MQIQFFFCFFQVKPELVEDEPLHDNENKPNVLESIPDLENNKNHQKEHHHNLHHHIHNSHNIHQNNQIQTDQLPASNISVKSSKQASNNSVKSKVESSNNKEWNHEERRKVETRNNNMRQIIYKEVKRPGKNYDR